MGRWFSISAGSVQEGSCCTYYAWKRNYGGMEVAEERRLKAQSPRGRERAPSWSPSTWGIGFAFAAMFKSPVFFALCGAALFHLGLDFLFHHDDGRAHFWPLSNWIFESPVSYWDPNHYGTIVGAIEVALSLLCCGILWQRFKGWLMRALTVILGAMEFAPFVIWAIMF